MTKIKKVSGALGLAAVLGVAGFAAAHAADTTSTVTYQVTINQSTEISSDSTSVTGTLTNGGSVTEIGSGNTLTASSNNAKGYTITASVESSADLANGSYTIPYATSLSQGTSGWNLTASSSSSAVTVGSFDGFASDTSATVATTSTASAADSISIKMQAAASSSQEAGTYSREVTYTISENQ